MYHYNPLCSSIVTTCNTISLPDSINYCSDTTAIIPATVSGPDSIFNVRWTPSSGISDTGILDPTLSITHSAWYYLTVQSLIPGNLVVNGDFSAGNTGFSSGYPYGSGAGSLLPPGVYAISTDPIDENIYAASIHDHTTGSGNMLAVNGASTPINVWCETITVTPNTYYDFSAWFANWSSDTTANFPEIQYEVNGTLTGPVFSFPHPDGLWTKFATAIYSGTSTSITICINDQQTSFAGNDFAIDDISLQQICTSKDSVYVKVAARDTVHASTDTAICVASTPFIIDGPAGYTSYLWNTGSTSADIYGDTGRYHVYAYRGCTVLTDSIHVSTIKDTLYAHSDTSACINGDNPVIINGPAGYISYLWHTGSTNAYVYATGGIYQVYAYKDCNVLSDTIHVATTPIPGVFLGNDTTICAETLLRLGSPEPPGMNYIWNTGSTDSSISVSDSGTYILTVSERGCSTSDTILVNQLTKPFVYLEPDTSICQGETLQLFVPFTHALWSTGDTTQSILVSDAGIYTVSESNQCGTSTASIKVDVGLCDIWFPNAFSPDDDGHNDIIRAGGNLQYFSNYSLSIYNRWGERIFHTTDIYDGWDCKLMGTPQDVGTYFYMINYTLEGKKHLLKGDLELIR